MNPDDLLSVNPMDDRFVSVSSTIDGMVSYTWTDQSGAPVSPQRSPRLIDDVDGGEAKRELIQALWNKGIPKELSPYMMAEIVIEEGWVPGEELDRASVELSDAKRRIKELEDIISRLEEEDSEPEPEPTLEDGLKWSRSKYLANPGIQKMPSFVEQLSGMSATQAYQEMLAVSDQIRKMNR